jgi:hypothetical protein
MPSEVLKELEEAEKRSELYRTEMMADEEN